MILPKSRDKDIARREFILNVLLGGSLLLSLFAFFVALFVQEAGLGISDAISPYFLLLFVAFFCLLFSFSRKGKVLLSSFLLIFFLYVSSLFTSFKWGVDVPQSWMLYALVVVMSGVLIGTRFAFYLTLSIVFFLFLFSYWQLAGIFSVSSSWRTDMFTFGDIVVFNITLLIIALLAWLSNREIEKSLHRARASEAALKAERNLLEIKVEERTQELKQAQLEKVTQLYRFAELGRLSSGLFHDLVTPLSVISLNLEALKNTQDKEKIANIQATLKRAMQATRFLETSVKAVRQQLQSQELKKIFSVNKEIKQVLQLVQHKIRGFEISIAFTPSQEIKMYGNPVKLSQVITNLVLNAIDAYDESTKGEKKTIILALERKNKSILFSVQDFGKGILESDIRYIFEPFFTTKASEKGTGIGLSISRDIVEKSFGGKMFVTSKAKMGTTFTIILPDKPSMQKKKNNGLPKRIS